MKNFNVWAILIVMNAMTYVSCVRGDILNNYIPSCLKHPELLVMRSLNTNWQQIYQGHIKSEINKHMVNISMIPTNENPFMERIYKGLRKFIVHQDDNTQYDLKDMLLSFWCKRILEEDMCRFRSILFNNVDAFHIMGDVCQINIKFESILMSLKWISEDYLLGFEHILSYCQDKTRQDSDAVEDLMQGNLNRSLRTIVRYRMKSRTYQEYCEAVSEIHGIKKRVANMSSEWHHLFTEHNIPEMHKQLHKRLILEQRNPDEYDLIKSFHSMQISLQNVVYMMDLFHELANFYLLFLWHSNKFVSFNTVD